MFMLSAVSIHVNKPSKTFLASRALSFGDLKDASLLWAANRSTHVESGFCVVVVLSCCVFCCCVVLLC